MEVETTSPLNAAHLATINLILEKAAAAIELVARCEKCGNDVEREKRLLIDAQNYIKNVKAEFFPNEI